MLVDCYECQGKVSERAFICPHCGAPPPTEDSLTGKKLPYRMPVMDVRNVNVDFWNLVQLMVKGVFAAIPAALIVFFLTLVGIGVFSAFVPLFRSLLHR